MRRSRSCERRGSGLTHDHQAVVFPTTKQPMVLRPVVFSFFRPFNSVMPLSQKRARPAPDHTALRGVVAHQRTKAPLAERMIAPVTVPALIYEKSSPLFAYETKLPMFSWP